MIGIGEGLSAITRVTLTSPSTKTHMFARTSFWTSHDGGRRGRLMLCCLKGEGTRWRTSTCVSKGKLSWVPVIC